jgi:hypothetical protein
VLDGADAGVAAAERRRESRGGDGTVDRRHFDGLGEVGAHEHHAGSGPGGMQRELHGLS